MKHNINEKSVVSFIFNETTKKWQIINGEGITGKITTSEEKGKEHLLEFCLCYPILNLVKNEQEILLKYQNSIVGKIEYWDKKQENNMLFLRFFYDILSVIHKERRDVQIVPGFHPQECGIKMTIKKNAVVLNNIFGKNNHLSEEEQDFFLKSFQDYQIYKELLNTKLILKK